MRDQDALTEQILSLKKDVEEIKLAQRSGKGNIRAYEYVSASDYDLHFVSSARITRYVVTATYPNPDNYEIINLYWFTSNSTSVPTGDTAGVFVPISAQAYPPERGRTRWILSYRNVSFPPEYTFGTINYDSWTKFIFYGTSEITVSIALY